jgi:hypothetical protein
MPALHVIDIVLDAKDSVVVDGSPCAASDLLAFLQIAATRVPQPLVRVRNAQSDFYDVGRTVFIALQAGFPEDAVSIENKPSSCLHPLPAPSGRK